MSSELRSPKFATLCKKWRPLSHNMMLQTVSTRSWNRRSAHAYAQYEKWPCSDADFPVSLVLVPKGNASPKIRNLGDRTNFFFGVDLSPPTTRPTTYVLVAVYTGGGIIAVL